MNIQQAKDQIKSAMSAYLSRDEYGNYRIPIEDQRPVFLMGPPGIGKTAVMKQIAQELNVGLVSYSMTHHTRQSALGLPYIVKRTYDGKEYEVSEYTMSEIIASVYDMIEKGGCQEGILFLDEINCVSETLTPSMLQFLQFKTFGRHHVPAGWIVVTAGNPPEYNRSAREFDIVTWDRLKRIDIEPDYETWKQYANHRGVHPAVMTYLSSKPENFYKVETTVDGKRFVTARGWIDLSDMITVFELSNEAVDLRLMGQYLQNPDIAEDFAIYYDLFNKYRSDYQVEAILSGNPPQEILARATHAPFDERLSLLGLLLDNVSTSLRQVVEEEDALTQLHGLLLTVREATDVTATVHTLMAEQQEKMEKAQRRGALSEPMRRCYQRIIRFLKEQARAEADFAKIKTGFAQEVSQLSKDAEHGGNRLDCLFRFVETVWADGQEMLILVTELTSSRWGARFISRYGCQRYYAHSESLAFYERQVEIIKRIEQLETSL